MNVGADFPVKSLCSALNFRPEERKVSGFMIEASLPEVG